MAVTTLPQPNHRLLGRLVLAILIVAIVVTAFLVGLSQRLETSVKPSGPAVTTPTAPALPSLGATTGPSGGDSTCLTVVRHTRTC